MIRYALHFPLNVGPDMYRIVLGKVSTLSAAPLPPGLREQSTQGPRRERWLAGRALLSHTLSPLPEIVLANKANLHLRRKCRYGYNLSHSGDDIALLLSDEGEVGLRYRSDSPRAPNWHWLANAVFSLGERVRWTPCILISDWKCSGASGRAKKPSLNSVAAAPGKSFSVDSTYHSSLSVSHCQLENLTLRICTPTPFYAHRRQCAMESVQLTESATRLPIYSIPEQVISMTNT